MLRILAFTIQYRKYGAWNIFLLIPKSLTQAGLVDLKYLKSNTYAGVLLLRSFSTAHMQKNRDCAIVYCNCSPSPIFVHMAWGTYIVSGWVTARRIVDNIGRSALNLSVEFLGPEQEWKENYFFSFSRKSFKL